MNKRYLLDNKMVCNIGPILPVKEVTTQSIDCATETHALVYADKVILLIGKLTDRP